MSKEFIENKKNLDQTLINIDQKLSNFKILIDACGDTPKPIETKSLIDLISSALSFYDISFEQKTPVLNELLNSGNSNLLKSTKLRLMLEQFEQQTGNLIGTKGEYYKFRIDLYDLLIGSGIRFNDMTNNENLGFNKSNFSKNTIKILENSKFQNLLFTMSTSLLYYKSIAPEISKLFVDIIDEIDKSPKE